MTVDQALQLAAFGAAFGAVGQVVRAVAGLKKLAEDPDSGFSASTMAVSVVIGAVAGVLSALAMDFDPANIGKTDIFSIVAAGYAGADFIEAFMKKWNAPPVPAAAPAGGSPSAPAGGGAAAPTAEPTAAGVKAVG